MIAPIACLIFVLVGASTVLAQHPSPTAQSSTASTPAQAFASVYPGSATYDYLGCYNETTGDADVGNVRALAGGNMVRILKIGGSPY